MSNGNFIAEAQNIYELFSCHLSLKVQRRFHQRTIRIIINSKLSPSDPDFEKNFHEKNYQLREDRALVIASSMLDRQDWKLPNRSPVSTAFLLPALSDSIFALMAARACSSCRNRNRIPCFASGEMDEKPGESFRAAAIKTVPFTMTVTGSLNPE